MEFEEKKFKSDESVSSERPEALEKNPKFLLEETEAEISGAEKELEMIEKNDVPIQEVKKKINIIRRTLNSALHVLQILGTSFPLFMVNPQKIEAAPPSGFASKRLKVQVLPGGQRDNSFLVV